LLHSRAPLVWFSRLPKIPLRASAIWVRRSRRVVHLTPTSRFSRRRARAFIRHRDLPKAWVPLQSLTRDPRHQRQPPASALSRGFLSSRCNPPIEIHHSQAFACLGHVASLHLPCASTPFSLDELPGVLSTRCIHRTSPKRARLRRKSRHSYEHRIPSCDPPSNRSSRHLARFPVAPFKIGRHEDVLIGQPV
jgi:5-methylcytosine-specific restriction endonuclease McrA